MVQHSEEILNKLALIEKKYAEMGQDMGSYLEGLLYANILSYWDYIQLDTLLSIQKPKTDFKDEMIFITYHQISELMFQLIIHELKQLSTFPHPDETLWLKHLTRVNRYYEHLISSFDIMIHGMDREDFKKFRMALLPGSGFQSVSYRKIELYCTELRQLMAIENRDESNDDMSLQSIYGKIYWKQSNRELKSGHKTLTLRMFEDKYDDELIRLAQSLETANLFYRMTNSAAAILDNAEVVKQLRALDLHANLYWPIAHFEAANKHLKEKKEVLIATGGTNWQTYLPPHRQKIIFFPSLWRDDEKQNWGRLKKAPTS